MLSVLSIHTIPGFDSIDVYRGALLIFKISGGCRVAINSHRYKPLQADTSRYKPLHIATDQVAP